MDILPNEIEIFFLLHFVVYVYTIVYTEEYSGSRTSNAYNVPFKILILLYNYFI